MTVSQKKLSGPSLPEKVSREIPVLKTPSPPGRTLRVCFALPCPSVPPPDLFLGTGKKGIRRLLCCPCSRDDRFSVDPKKRVDLEILDRLFPIFRAGPGGKSLPVQRLQAILADPEASPDRPAIQNKIEETVFPGRHHIPVASPRMPHRFKCPAMGHVKPGKTFLVFQ